MLAASHHHRQHWRFNPNGLSSAGGVYGFYKHHGSAERRWSFGITGDRSMMIEFLTAVLAFITAVYAYLTFRMTKASEASVEMMRSQSEAMARPYVTVVPFIRPHTTLLYLRVSNMGKMAAQNLHLSLDRDFFQFGEVNRPYRNLRTISAFAMPIDSFAPGMELIFGLAQGFVIFGEGTNPGACPTQLSITATYEFLGKSVTEVNRVDLRPYIGSEGERDPVVEELERIRNVMEKAK
jgi:hypothetical protein